MTKRKRFDAVARTSAIAVFEDELKTRSDGYVEHLAHGGKADCGEEFHLDALYMAIAALREQEERSRGCEFCAETLKRFDHVLAVADYCEDDIVYEPKFCPMCGRRLEEV